MPDLAERWTVDPTGFVWTFQLRDDAGLARRRAGHRRGRRVHDPGPPGSRPTTGRPPAPGTRSRSRRPAPRTVMFTLKTPLGGFLQAATQPIAPAHLLAGIPVADLPDDPFGRQPIGSGPFAVASLTDDAAELIPAATPAPRRRSGAGRRRHVAPTRWRPPRRSAGRRGPVPYLAGIEFRFFDDPKALADAYRSGSLDAASGLAAGDGRGARGDGREPGAALSGLDPDGRPAQPATGPSRVREPGRPDGAARGHRPTPDRHRRVRDGPPGRRPARSRRRRRCSTRPPTRPSRTTVDAAEAALKAAGWTQAADGWHLPGAKAPSTSSCSARTRHRTRPRSRRPTGSPATGRRSG